MKDVYEQTQLGRSCPYFLIGDRIFQGEGWVSIKLDLVCLKNNNKNKNYGTK